MFEITFLFRTSVYTYYINHRYNFPFVAPEDDLISISLYNMISLDSMKWI